MYLDAEPNGTMNGSHMDPLTTLVLDIPDHLTVSPPRTRQVGGIARIHPGWNPLNVSESVVRDVPHWGAGVVRSTPAPSSVTFHRAGGSFQGISVKTGREVSGLGPHELAHFEELEANPEWVTYELQGLEAVWNTNSYRPDYHGLHTRFGVTAGEVKADVSYFEADQYAVKMTNADRTFGAVGITFQKVDGTTMHANVRRRLNARRACCDRFTSVDPDAIANVEDLLHRHGEVPMSQVHAILSNDSRVAQSMVHALLCRRVLAYDLDLRVDARTLVSAPPAAAIAVDIRAIERVEQI